jgi:hypothetical protein
MASSKAWQWQGAKVTGMEFIGIAEGDELVFVEGRHGCQEDYELIKMAYGKEL